MKNWKWDGLEKWGAMIVSKNTYDGEINSDLGI